MASPIKSACYQSLLVCLCPAPNGCNGSRTGNRSTLKDLLGYLQSLPQLMLISNSRKFIFFHIPKNGGTSLTDLFDLGLAWNDIIIGGTQTGEIFNGCWARRFKLFKHSTPDEAQKVIDKELLNDYRKLIFVRDPIHRFKSAAQFLYQVVKEKRDWILDAYSNEELSEIASLESLTQVIGSSFFARISEKDPGRCNESELCFHSQSHYLPSDPEINNNNFNFYKLDALEESLVDLINNGIITESEVSKSGVLVKRSNKSDKSLADNLSDKDLGILRNIYSMDYDNFFR